MTDRLPEPNHNPFMDEELSEEQLEKKYPFLTVAPKEDWPGILKRAEREGVPVEQLKLRESDGIATAGLNADDDDFDLPGLLARARRERKQLSKMQMRGGDDVRRIYESMYFLLEQAGFPVREYFDEETGPVTKRSLELKDGIIKVIAETKLNFGGGEK